MIVRSYMCPDCAFMMDVTLTADQWDQEPPFCPKCAGQTQQEFKPVAIGGSNRAKAVKIAEDIVEHDYGVADFKAEGRPEGKPIVRYKDSSSPPSQWMRQNANIAQAMALGRETRRRYGDGLDVLQQNLKSGDQPDLIEISKRRSMKVW